MKINVQKHLRLQLRHFGLSKNLTDNFIDFLDLFFRFHSFFGNNI